MKCYYHDNRDAVAVCRVCGRGLCRDSSTEADNQMVCRGVCEEQMKMFEGTRKGNLGLTIRGFRQFSRLKRMIYVYLLVLIVAALFYFFLIKNF